MPPPLPPLNALRTLEVAARHLSFKKAADALHVTPAAVSHQIHVLEEFFGIELFERTRRGLELTPAARACLPRLREGFAALHEAVEQLQRHQGRDTLTVSAPPSFAHRWLVPRLHRFLVKYPQIDVQLVSRMHGFGHAWTQRESEAESVRSWVEDSDVVIILGDGRYSGLNVQGFLPLALTLLLSPALLPAGAGSLRIEDAARLPQLHDDRGILHEGTSFWALWCQRLGLAWQADPQARSFSHAMFAIEAAVDGLGAVVSSPELATVELANGRLLAPFPVVDGLALAYHAVSTPPSAQRPAVRLFTDWLRSEGVPL